MAYHRFKTEDGEEYGSFEVFWDDQDDAGMGPRNYDRDGNPVEPGWYWWSCFPGCLPDSDAMGPFKTEAEALQDAMGAGVEGP